MPETITHIVDIGSSSADQAIQDTKDAANVAAFEASNTEASYKDKNGDLQTIKGDPSKALELAKESLQPKEERPEYIDEADWKGNLKDSIQALKSAAHFKKVEAGKEEKKADEKKKPDDTKTAEPYFNTERISSINAALSQNNGQMPDDMREQLKKDNPSITDDLINVHVRGLNSILRLNTRIMMDEAAGGDQELYGKMREHFESLPPAEQKLLAINPGTEDEEELIAKSKALAASYYSVNAREARLMSGAGRNGISGRIFNNRGESQAYINDLRWSDDGPIGTAYRAEYDSIWAASRAKGIDI